MQNIKSFLIKISPYILGTLLVVFYLTEAFSKISELFTGEYSLLSRATKLICIIFFSIFILKKSPRKSLAVIVIPVFIYIIGNFFLPQGYTYNSIVTLGKYLFPIILYIFSDKITNNRTFLFNVFEKLIIANSILIILGFIFNIEMFQTYDGDRFGYNGLLLTSATSTYVYIISFFYFLTKNQQKILTKDKKFLFILISTLLIGTKSLYISFFFISFFFAYKNIKPSYRHPLLYVCFLGGSFLFYIVFYKIGMFSKIRESHGLLSSILSYRNELFINDTLPFIKQNWTFPNYLFGGVNDIETRTEMSLIDLFYFFGLIGGLWYLYIYYKSYFTFKKNFTIKVFLFLIILISTLAGNFFFYSTIPIYLLILKERILFSQEELNERNL
ncbi:MAG: hypothetical protein L3J08_04760 [Flavobacteriaceae bacterium]|nr:hypothetical protein [Flavobacteriaceae bacterium]